MKRLKISLAFALLVLLSMQLCAFAAEFRADPYLTKNFTLSGAGKLNVETAGSAVAVTAGSGNEVVVDMYVKLDGREISSQDPAVERELENYDLNISQSGNTISLTVKRKMNNNRNNKLNLSFKIKAPKELSSTIQSSGGSIALDGLNGSQNIETSGGSIQVVNGSGVAKTQSSGGSLRVENFQGDVDAQSSGGSVKVSQLVGDVQVASSGGSVTLEQISGSIDASTSGGSIRAQLSQVEKALRVKSSGGSITVVVPGGLGLDLDLSGGRVNSSLSNFDGEIKKDRVLGKINGGGVPVTMESSGGSVNLEFN